MLLLQDKTISIIRRGAPLKVHFTRRFIVVVRYLNYCPLNLNVYIEQGCIKPNDFHWNRAIDLSKNTFCLGK